MIDTPCIMNNICKYIEAQNFSIKQKIRTSSSFDYQTLQSHNFNLSNYKKQSARLIAIIDETFKAWASKNHKTTIEKSLDDNLITAKFDRKLECSLLKQKLESIVNNEELLTDLLIQIFYVSKPSYSKSNLWAMCGKQIYTNIKNNMTGDTFYFPVKNPNGTLTFLYEKYQIEKITLPSEPQLGDNILFKQLLEEGLV